MVGTHVRMQPMHQPFLEAGVGTPLHMFAGSSYDTKGGDAPISFSFSSTPPFVVFFI